MPGFIRQLVLRPLNDADLASILRLLRSEQSKSSYGVPRPHSETSAREWLTDSVRHTGIYAVDLDGEGFVGTTRISDFTLDRRSGQLSYWIGRPYRGQGIGSTAAQAAMSEAFHTLRLTHIQAYTFESNVASRRILARLGFRCLGVDPNVRPLGIPASADCGTILAYCATRSAVQMRESDGSHAHM